MNEEVSRMYRPCVADVEDGAEELLAEAAARAAAGVALPYFFAKEITHVPGSVVKGRKTSS
jgi:hypothetical protein